jgi:hypothetical protein
MAGEALVVLSAQTLAEVEAQIRVVDAESGAPLSGVHVSPCLAADLEGQPIKANETDATGRVSFRMAWGPRHHSRLLYSTVDLSGEFHEFTASKDGYTRTTCRLHGGRRALYSVFGIRLTPRLSTAMELSRL